MQTIPELAAAWGVRTHCLRSFLKRRPTLLQRLGVRRIGYTLAFSEAAAAELQTVFEGRKRRTLNAVKT